MPILPSHLVFVELYLACVELKCGVEKYRGKHVSLRGKRWTTDVVGDRIYLDEVSASFYSEEENTKEDIRIEKGCGRIWCVEYEGERKVVIDALLPKDDFNTILEMAIGFSCNHRFGAVFRMSEPADLKPEGGFYSVMDIEVSLTMIAADDQK